MTEARTAGFDAAARPPRSQWRDVWDQFKTHRGALVGLVIFGAILFAVVAGPLIWRLDPTYVDPNPVNMLKLRNQGPSLAHPFGTDQLGRDMLARIMAGGRVSIAVGLTAMLLALFLGTLIGVVAGFFRRLDGILMPMTDLFLSLPLLPLLLLMVTLFREPLGQGFGTETGIFLLMVGAIGVTSWMHTARIVRGEVLTLKEREFVLAARSIGTPSRRMVLRHILPNVMSPIMVSATLGIANAIITESALSFLGLGFPPDTPTWGRLLFDAKDYLDIAPHWALFAGGMIFITVLTINFIGDGLRDALDPRKVL